MLPAACHAVELAYVFNNLDETIYTGDNIDTTLAQNVQEMWMNFIRTGNPSTTEYEWTSYDTATRSTMILGEDIRLEQDPLGTQRETLWSLLKYGFNGCYTNLSYNVPTVWKLVASMGRAYYKKCANNSDKYLLSKAIWL